MALATAYGFGKFLYKEICLHIKWIYLPIPFVGVIIIPVFL